MGKLGLRGGVACPKLQSVMSWSAGHLLNSILSNPKVNTPSTIHAINSDIYILVFLIQGAATHLLEAYRPAGTFC